jgi:aryl-alcohol dehydrogenase-like predicted oxidoreductase
LGNGGLRVSALGFGAMALVHGIYGPTDERQGLTALRHVIDSGIDLIDTADFYGLDGHNERLVGRAITGRRDEVAIARQAREWLGRLSGGVVGGERGGGGGSSRGGWRSGRGGRSSWSRARRARGGRLPSGADR